MKNLFNCLICCASTSGGGIFSDEFEKSLLFDFLCGMLNVELTEEYSWDFSRDTFPLCLRCCCVIRDMFHIQMLDDAVELSVIEKAEKMKQTIFDCVQLRRKQLPKSTSEDGFEEDARFEFFRNQVIQKNSEQFTNTLKISVKPCSNNDAPKTLLPSTKKGLENDGNIDKGLVTSSSKPTDKKSTLKRSKDSEKTSDIPLDDNDTLDFQWPSWEDWGDFSLPFVNEEPNEEINNTLQDDALYQALINEKCNMDIGPLLDKANLASCPVIYDENFVAPKTPVIDDTNDGPENILSPPSNDSCEVITISDDSQESDDDCAIIEKNNNGKERTRISKKPSKYSKSKTTSTNKDKVHIVLTTHSLINDANSQDGNTNIVIEQKTPVEVRGGIFMPVAGAQDTWQCILCGKIVKHFKNHKAVHFPGQFHCNLCQAVFKRKDNLLAHHKAKH